MFLRSRRRRRGAAAALAIYRFRRWSLTADLFLLPGDRAGRTLSRPRIRVRALPAYRQPLAVAQTAIAAEIHQPFDVHRDLSPQITLDRVVAVDQLAHPQDLVVRHLMNPPLERDPDTAADLHGLGAADAVNVGQSDRYPLLVGDIHASDARHLRFSSRRKNRFRFRSSTGQVL